MKNKLKAIFLFLVVLTTTAIADTKHSPLSPDQAFQFSFESKQDKTFLVHFTIAKGYHLYRESFAFNVISPSSVTLGEPLFAREGKTYQDQITITVPIENTAQQPTTLTVTYKGCADFGFCYPPITKQINLYSMQNPISQLLSTHHWPWILMSFFFFGLLLSFTPCVFPMIPILSSIIAGADKNITSYKAFKLSLSYVLAMALTYALVGIFAGYTGHYLQITFQSPWAIISLSIIFILLALSLFGLYEIQLPNFLQNRIAILLQKQSGGTYISVALMGCLATLVLSPCVSAPLIGVLSFIGETGDAVLGGVTLFTMGLGMGLPLLIIGALEGKLFLKAGAWMKGVKIILGILMLSAAASLLLRIVPIANIFQNNPITFNQSVFHFKTIGSFAELEQLQAQAKKNKQWVLLDFYASWCPSCVKLDSDVFTDPRVQASLKNVLLLRADITQFNSFDEQLLQKFGVIGPPTLLFFNPEGLEKADNRIVGEVGVTEFLKHMSLINASKPPS